MMFLVFVFLVVVISVACGVFIGSAFIMKQLGDIKDLLEK